MKLKSESDEQVESHHICFAYKLLRSADRQLEQDLLKITLRKLEDEGKEINYPQHACLMFHSHYVSPCNIQAGLK